GLSKCARLKLRIDRHGDVGRYIDSLADGAEAVHGKRDRVFPGTDIDDVVVALGVGGRGSNALDQRGACGFDFGSRHEGAGAVFDLSGDVALRGKERGEENYERGENLEANDTVGS